MSAWKWALLGSAAAGAGAWMTLGAALTGAGLLAAGCGGDGGTSGGGGGTVDAGGSGGAGGSDGNPGCTDECCPTDDSCYLDGQEGPGAECLALRDNNGQKRIQMRQTWNRATTPLGNTNALVYGILSSRSELPMPQCNMLGKSGYIQVADYDLTDDDPSKHTARTGYAQFVTDIGQAKSQGLCLVDFEYGGATTAGAPGVLPDAQLSPGAAALPWRIQPVTAKRLDTDFDLATDRDQLLADIEADPDHSGVFYLDEEKGETHGFSPLFYVVFYKADGTDPMGIPIHESETRARYNSPDDKNCVGVYRGAALDPGSDCVSVDANNPAWGCKDGECPAGEAPATSRGYFLITELEQIFSDDLGSTLCVSYPTQAEAEKDGFVDPNDTYPQCRTSSKWNPTPTSYGDGLPSGDWCSKTNSAATADCHDAYLSEAYHTFSAFPVKDGTCGAL